MSNTPSIRNIALFAHVDAGKTSVTEQFLFHSGKIRTLGSVDKGNTQTDSLEVEKQRGITVNATLLRFIWKNTKINLIDTPGHIDFSAETEKAIQAIDCAIVLVSASEGVQAQTENMVSLLQKHHKPFLIFINKIDRSGVDLDAVIAEIERELNCKTVPLQKVHNEGTNTPELEGCWSPQNYMTHTNLIEKIIEEDAALLAQYFDDVVLDFDVLDQQLRLSVHEQSLTPVLFGAAKLDLGIDTLLNAMINYLPQPVTKPAAVFGVVFNTKHIKGEGKWAAVRLFDGSIFARQPILNATKNSSEKARLIKNIDIQNQEIIQSFEAGDMAWIQGFNQAEPGDYIGTPPIDLPIIKTQSALLSTQLSPIKETEINALVEALYILNNEDPSLNFTYLKEEHELHISIRGEIQKEILQSILLTRFGLDVLFAVPTVIYKETPTVKAEGYVRYWMPKPCWAIMRFNIEPGERGSGVQFLSKVGVNDIKQHYQNDVKKTIPTALQQGVLGWQVDDIIITLIEGEDHEMHTKSNDFAIATPMGIMDGLTKAKMTLLEPILAFKILAPDNFLGSITSELIKRRATMDNPEIFDQTLRLTGLIPVATSLDLVTKLSALTSGKAKINTQFKTYQSCAVDLGKTRDYKGISPIDRAKYILKARKALM